MTFEKKEELCREFFKRLTDHLSETHECVGSCNKDKTLYLIPKGTVGDLSYYGKPENSYRFSDHWTWYANVRKCENEKYIQCWCKDMPGPRERVAPGKPSRPIRGIAVAKTDEEGNYRVIFGEYFDKGRKQWCFLTPELEEV